MRVSCFLVLVVSLVAIGPLSADTGPVSLFDGKTFTGWNGDIAKIWHIEDGCIVGGSLDHKVPRNEFLATNKSYGNFVLRLKFKLLGDSKKNFVNSGVQFWSERVPDSSEMNGYQADLGDPNYWGSLYDESRRKRTLAPVDMKKVNKVLRRDDWNDFKIQAEGRRIQIFVNGVRTVDYTEKDDAIPTHGHFGLQIHGGGPAQVWFKDITLDTVR